MDETDVAVTWHNRQAQIFGVVIAVDDTLERLTDFGRRSNGVKGGSGSRHGAASGHLHTGAAAHRPCKSNRPRVVQSHHARHQLPGPTLHCGPVAKYSGAHRVVRETEGHHPRCDKQRHADEDLDKRCVPIAAAVQTAINECEPCQHRAHDHEQWQKIGARSAAKGCVEVPSDDDQDGPDNEATRMRARAVRAACCGIDSVRKRTEDNNCPVGQQQQRRDHAKPTDRTRGGTVLPGEPFERQRGHGDHFVDGCRGP